MKFDFSKKAALVTEGSGGIGRAICTALAERGAEVIVGYSSGDDAAEKVVSEIKAKGGSAFAVKADVSNTDEVEEMFGRIRKDPGHLDILVNTQSVATNKLLSFMSEDDWDSVINTNLKGVFNTSKSASRMMIGQNYGKIINITSSSAILGGAGETNYASAMGGVISFTKSLARELARFNITVNAVSPGRLETEETDGLSEEAAQELLYAVPLGRFGRATDVAGAVLFLASDMSDYITGQVICVDGGLT